MISIIVAIGEGNRVIGDKGKLPWHIPEDLKRFKALTTGHPIIMGRNTFLSIGRVLPNRTNIVLSDMEWLDAPDGIVIVRSLENALEKAKSAPGSEEIFVIGGGMVYGQALSCADRLYLTLIHGDFHGDAFFPEYEKIFSKVMSREARESEGFRYEFLVLERE
ncbi:MAG: dihydrofolate reductase [Candidatus Moraniibacteriota bacterium]|nr:MAG: dihydrofolate reductase [Candidatus Moranbacteria bacterium]